MSCYAKPLTPELEKDLEWNKDMLVKTSRSFALVINALGSELRDAVMVFYIVLRALDTVEDDAAFPKEKKLPLLNEFYLRLRDPNWTLSGCGENDNEKLLMSNFNKVARLFLALKPGFQDVISDITKRMGKGMSEFVQREVVSVEDWDLYCHYVAGLVGIGLSGLFATSGLEDPNFVKWDKLSNSMGLFLQKTNIIRDYREDIDQNPPRIFWPRAIWELYADKLENFREDKHAQQANYCLNHLITNAFHHIPDCLEYMSRLKDRNVFNFCAIPQVMAIATLNLCYNNHDVFLKNVKIPQQETMKITKTIDQHGLAAVHSWFYHYLNEVVKKIPFTDPHRSKMLAIIAESRSIIEKSKLKLIPIGDAKL